MAGVILFSTPSPTTALAGSPEESQLDTQSLEERSEGAALEKDDDDGAEDDESESVDPSAADQSTITAEEAKRIAAEHLSLDPSAVRFIELEREGSRLIYSVEFDKDIQQAEVEVDAYTGDIVSVELDDD